MKKKNQSKESFLNLDPHKILDFFDKKIGPIPYLIYPSPHLELNFEKISRQY